MMKGAGIITVDEAREMIGYDPLGGASAILDPFAGALTELRSMPPLDAAAMAYGTKAD